MSRPARSPRTAEISAIIRARWAFAICSREEHFNPPLVVDLAVDLARQERHCLRSARSMVPMIGRRDGCWGFNGLSSSRTKVVPTSATGLRAANCLLHELHRAIHRLQSFHQCR